jgi:glycosyltransferase involved in cell wall biosynthesis
VRIQWVTNYAAPYRRPVWARISEHHDLEVVLLESPEQFRAHPGNRGTDWESDSSRGYTTRHLPTWAVRRGEHRYYVSRRWRWFPSSEKPDVMLLGGWESPVFWQASEAARRAGIPRVGFYESIAASQRHRTGPISAARGRFLRSLDAVVTPGPAAAAAVEASGVERNRIHVGFNAVDVDWIHREAVAQRRPAEQGGHAYLFLGQLVPRKNPEALIEAFRRIAARGDTLTVAGVGPLRNRLEQTSRGLDVQFAGDVPYTAVPALLARHQTLVLPSHEEVWGLVVNEALAAGLHVVTSDRAGVSASVASMRGVSICGVSPAAIATAMAVSRNSWTGPISSPEILARTPAAFADVFLRAFEVARESR